MSNEARDRVGPTVMVLNLMACACISSQGPEAWGVSLLALYTLGDLSLGLGLSSEGARQASQRFRRHVEFSLEGAVKL